VAFTIIIIYISTASSLTGVLAIVEQFLSHLKLLLNS